MRWCATVLILLLPGTEALAESDLAAVGRCTKVLNTVLYEGEAAETAAHVGDVILARYCNMPYAAFRGKSHVGFDFLGLGDKASQEEYTEWRKDNCSTNSSRSSLIGESSPTMDLIRKVPRISHALAHWQDCMLSSNQQLQWSTRSGTITSPIISVNNDDGAKAKMRIIVLGNECHWRINKTNQVDCAGEEFKDTEMVNLMSTWEHWLEDAREIITVGTASCGLVKSNASLKERKKEEIDRARNRAKTLMIWMKRLRFLDVLSGDQSRRTLNLGLFKGDGDSVCNEGSTEADDQRPVLVVLVMEKENINTDVDYAWALHDAALKHEAFPDPKHYTTFKTRKH